MTPKTILVLDPDPSTQENTCFLLHIAGFAVTAVNEVNEALNWVTSRQRTLEPCQLLLISNIADEQIREISRQLKKSAITLPTLLLARGQRTFRFQPGQDIGQLFPLRVLYHPEQVAAAAREGTESASGSTAGAAAKAIFWPRSTRPTPPLRRELRLTALSTTDPARK